MLCCNVLQPSRAHGTRPQDYLTGPGIKRLEELNDAAHCIRVQHRKIDYELQIFQQESQDSAGGRDAEIRAFFDVNILGC